MVAPPRSHDWIQHRGRRAFSEAQAFAFARRHLEGIVPEATYELYGSRHLHMIGRQHFVSGTTAHDTPNLITRIHTSPTLVVELACLICLDYCLEIGDRHEGNWLIGVDGHLHAIDNEISSAHGQLLVDAMRPAARTLLLHDRKHTPLLLDALQVKLWQLARWRIWYHQAANGLRQLDELQSGLTLDACPLVEMDHGPF